VSKNFYKDISPFQSFQDFSQESHFNEAPTDWSLVITDIKGSTKAISQGRYKEVNTMGAASIVMVRKALGALDFPFVFGGDGATMLIPNTEIAKCCEKLAGLAQLSQMNYGLELRIGIISMEEIQRLGQKIMVGKYEITPGRSIAMLKGQGLSLGEKMIKSDERYLYKMISKDDADLEGLSCRWSPIRSRRGKILTILLSSRAEESAYTDFLNFLDELLPEGIDGANPMNMETAKHNSLIPTLRDEWKLHRGPSWKAIKVSFKILAGVLIFKIGFPGIFFDSKKYVESMKSHSDFRKFDDMLRMVIDCSLDELFEIRNYLNVCYERGEVFFGLHEADSSLMTCFVEGLGQGEHIHFIDAEDGGYAAAAVGLKAQISAAT
jgi:hypothetical protein